MVTQKRTEKHILIMAGGTGGHVFPALAVARYLNKQGWEVHWLGTADRMEARLVPKYGFDISFIDIQGIRGNGVFRKILAPFKIIHSIIQALIVMKKFKPDVVLGMGGFASGPGGVAAKLLGIPLVLHEQNAVPGVTNKLLSHISAATLCAFDNVFPNNKTNVQIVGNPVRPELIALGKKTKSPAHDALKILVVGGSLGAKVFNDILPNVIANLSKNCAVTIWHQVGKNNESWVKEAYQKLGLAGGVKVSEFIDDMEAAYQWADIVICRCGALTVSELAAVGLPSILVPYPYAVDDHQTINASVLVKAKAALLIKQQDLTVESLTEKLNALANEPQELASMGNRASSVAVVDSTEKVAKVCEHLATKGLK